jgi:hypothetical protein
MSPRSWPLRFVLRVYLRLCVLTGTSRTQEGDLILTGTPHGIGPITAGDKITCTLSDLASGKELSSLEFSAVDREGGYLFQPSS